MNILKFCTHCGKEIMDEAVICPSCGCSVQTANSTHIVEVDKSVSAGWIFLSLLFPLVGSIYFFAAIKTRPMCAKVCSIVAIISWLTGLSDFLGGFIFGFLGAYLGII